MGGYANNPYGVGNRAVRSIDRKRDRERHLMMKTAQKHAEEIATKLVQRLLDAHVIETNSEGDIRTHFTNLFVKMRDLEEFDINFKIAPLRRLAPDPNWMSLFVTQHIIEDLIDHSKIIDIFGDEQEIYLVVDSILDHIRPEL